MLTIATGSVAGVLIPSNALTVSEKAADAVFEAESVTFNMKEEVPAAVGVPVSAPAAERLSHEGNEEPLATVQVKPVPVPPLATRLAE